MGIAQALFSLVLLFFFSSAVGITQTPPTSRSPLLLQFLGGYRPGSFSLLVLLFFSFAVGIAKADSFFSFSSSSVPRWISPRQPPSPSLLLQFRGGYRQGSLLLFLFFSSAVDIVQAAPFSFSSSSVPAPRLTPSFRSPLLQFRCGVPRTRNVKSFLLRTKLSKASKFKSRIGQNMATHALFVSTAKKSTFEIISHYLLRTQSNVYCM